jgi:hypothetical protein
MPAANWQLSARIKKRPLPIAFTQLRTANAMRGEAAALRLAWENAGLKLDSRGTPLDTF